MNQPNEETKKSASEISQVDLAHSETPEVIRQIVPDAANKPDAASKVKSNDDRSPGLDRHEAVAQTTTAPETEIIRKLVIPEAVNAAKSDDDRSPGLDRHETTANLTPPPAEAEAMRELVIPEADSDPKAE